MTKPKAIVGCEESQKVCSALIRNGWDAISVDLLPTSGNYPDKHYSTVAVAVPESACGKQQN